MAPGSDYAIGDWIVHTNYGVGQIKEVEAKCISGEEKRYYRVEAADSTFWIPFDQMDSDLLRPLCSEKEIQAAIDTLQKPAEELPANLKSRQSHIQDLVQRNTPRAIARLIRDLRGLKRKKGVLNNSESSALRTILQRFAREWAVVSGVSSDTTMSNLEKLLDPQQSLENGADMKKKYQKSAKTSQTSPYADESRWGSWPKRQTNKINR
jgi:RNA polymerase-interacting CarD/CdnL/TRCF family regulator